MIVLLGLALSCIPTNLALLSGHRQTRARCVRELAASNVVDQNCRQVGSLAVWLDAQGGRLSDTVALVQGNNGWGLTVETMCPLHAVVLSVPSKLVLDSARIEQELDETVDRLPPQWAAQQPEFWLFYKVLVEKDRGTASPWSIWLDSLPRQFGTGVEMDEIERRCLPPLAEALCEFERAKLAIFEQTLQSSTALPLNIKVDASLTTWAYNVVYSRCWKATDGSKRSRIVPVGDLFNHHVPSNIRVEEEDTGSSSTVDFVTKTDVSASSPLYLDYGLTNPHRFLILFGFCDVTMPEVFCQVLFDHPKPELVQLGCEDRSRMVYRTVDGAIAPAVWDCVLYALLEQAPALQQAFYEAHVSGNEVRKRAIADRFAKETATVLLSHVVGTLLGLDSLVETTRDLLRREGYTQHPRLPNIGRHNEFLQAVFGRVKQNLDRIVSGDR